MRAGPRILIPFEEFDKLQTVVGQYIIESKKDLITSKCGPARPFRNKAKRLRNT